MEGWEWIFLISSIFLVSPIKPAQPVPHSVGPQPIFQWTQVEYKYPNQEERQKDIENENFIPGSPAIIDVDVANPGKF